MRKWILHKWQSLNKFNFVMILAFLFVSVGLVLFSIFCHDCIENFLRLNCKCIYNDFKEKLGIVIGISSTITTFILGFVQFFFMIQDSRIYGIKVDTIYKIARAKTLIASLIVICLVLVIGYIFTYLFLEDLIWTLLLLSISIILSLLIFIIGIYYSNLNTKKVVKITKRKMIEEFTDAKEK